MEENNILKEESRAYEEIKFAHNSRRESVRNNTQERLQHHLEGVIKVEELMRESSVSVHMLGKKVNITINININITINININITINKIMNIKIK